MKLHSRALAPVVGNRTGPPWSLDAAGGDGDKADGLRRGSLSEQNEIEM